MIKDDYYSVGKVSKICKVSPKTLRFYDKIGIIIPDKKGDNSYRYYSKENLLSIPVVKYYKQMGFALEEMREFVNGNSYDYIEKKFRHKIEESLELERLIKSKREMLKEWYDLILEAQLVIENNVTEVSVKCIDRRILCFMDYEFEDNYMEAIINIEFNNFIERIDNAIMGPVMILFPSIESRINRTTKKVKIMQKTVKFCDKENSIAIGGSIYASKYHIGKHEDIEETYAKLNEWIDSNNYIAVGEVIERYVTDYWTTRDSSIFVTEIMIKITKKNKN